MSGMDAARSRNIDAMTKALSGRTHVLSVHRLRRTARKQERELQRDLDRRANGERIIFSLPLVPTWARGVRVEKAGLFQFTVVATESRGH